MKLDRLKKVITGAALGFMVLFSAGMISGTTAQAQDRNRDRGGEGREHRDSNRGQAYRGQDWNRGARGRDWDRDRGRVYTYPRAYPNYSPYGGGYGYGRSYGYGGGYGRSYGYGGYGGSGGYEEQRGYRDGLDRGQEDARSGRSPNPNNSSHYRSGNSLYRDGFRRGYSVGYRQFGGYRGR
jgi:hypothetical protein